MQPYKTLQKNIDESFEQTNKVIFKTQAQCCDIRESIIDKEQENTETINYCQMGKITAVCIQNTNYDDKVEIMLDNYEIKEENGKYYAVKKKSKYPKTYEECHELIVQWRECDCNPNSELVLCDVPIHDFCKLIVARNAYWKIAGEQMGLGKPWEPNWTDNYQKKFTISYYQGEINLTNGPNVHRLLAFPTQEMRDAFYENFKALIEQCKELL